MNISNIYLENYNLALSQLH